MIYNIYTAVCNLLTKLNFKCWMPKKRLRYTCWRGNHLAAC